MKLNLLLNNPGGVRSGYLNLEGEAVTNLDDVADANEVTEIIALDVLCYFPNHLADQVLNHWLGKLAHGATITLGQPDIREIARAVLNRTIDLNVANELLYGSQQAPGGERRNVLTMDQLVAVLESKGLKVLRKRIQDHRCVVVAQRP